MKYWKTLLCFYFGVVLGLFVQNVFWSALKNETVWSVKRFLTQSKRWFSGQRVGSAWSTHQVEEHFKWLFYCIVKWCFVSYIYIYLYFPLSHRMWFLRWREPPGRFLWLHGNYHVQLVLFSLLFWERFVDSVAVSDHVISSLHSLFMLFVVWLLRRYSSLAQVVCMDH